MGQARPLFVHFRPSLITISIKQIEKSLDGVLGSFLMGHPRTLFRLFSSFQTNNTIFTRKLCEKCPSSIHCRDSNQLPSGHESPSITNRPKLYFKPEWNIGEKSRYKFLTKRFMKICEISNITSAKANVTKNCNTWFYANTEQNKWFDYYR